MNKYCYICKCYTISLSFQKGRKNFITVSKLCKNIRVRVNVLKDEDSNWHLVLHPSGRRVGSRIYRFISSLNAPHEVPIFTPCIHGFIA